MALCLLVFQNLVIKTRSVEYMPFYLSLATFVMSLSFFAYGMLKFDPFIYVSITSKQSTMILLPYFDMHVS